MLIPQFVKNKRILLFFVGLFILQVALHLSLFDKDLSGHHLWRQSQTQINIQNFYRHDFNILNPRTNSFNGGKDNIQRMEFPIMQWLIACNYKIFGEHIAVTRICMFLFGFMGSIGAFYLFLALFRDARTAMCGAFAFSFSPVLYFYMMNPLPDVFAFSTGMCFLALFYRYYREKKNKYLIWSAFFFCLSVLAKLPYIMLGIIPFTWMIQLFISKESEYRKHISRIINYYIIALIPAALWYGWVIVSWGTTTIVGGIINNPITKDKFFSILSYHLFTMWPQDLIGYVSLIPFCIGLVSLVRLKKHTPVFWHWIAYSLVILSYFLYEFTLIDIVHDYYMMPYIILFFVVVAFGFHRILNGGLNLSVLLLVILIAIPLSTWATTRNWWSVEESYFDETLLTQRDKLRKLVPDDEKVIMLNDKSNYMFSYLIDKQGHIFDNDYLPAPWIEDMIKRFGVHYMFSTSRKVDTSAEVKPLLDSMIYIQGDVRVFKLKSK